MVTALVSWSPALYSAVFGLATLACFLGAWWARNLEPVGVRRGLLSLLVTSGGWAAAQGGFLVAPSPESAAVLYTVALVVGLGTVGAWLYFCSAYTGRSYHRWPTVLLGAGLLFGAVVVAKLTNAWHGLYFGIEVARSPLTTYSVERRALYWTTTAVSYAFVAIGFFMLLELLMEVRGTRGPLAALFGVTLVPVLFNVIAATSPALADVYHEPLGVAAFALGALALFGSRLEAFQWAGTNEDPCFVVGPDGALRNYNGAAARLLRSAGVDNAIGTPLSRALPPIAETRANGHAVAQLPSPGGPSYYQVAESRLGTSARPERLLVLNDVTEREQTFQERERFVQSITESVTDGIFQTSREGGLRYVNQAFAEMFGYESPEAIMEVDPEALYADPSERDRLFEQLLDEGDFTGKEVRFRRKDGSVFVGRVSTTLVYDDSGTPRYHNGVVIDITEQKNRERALRAAKEEAEEAARFKEAMLANMSHEVRTPLSPILGYAEILQERLDGPGAEFAGYIREGGRRLQETLEAMLSLSKLEGGAYEPRLELVEIGDLAHDTQELLSPQAEEKGVELTLEVPDGEAKAYLDEEGSRQILRNLVENAIKFTPEGGRVWIRAWTEANKVLLEVEDTGIGVAEDVQDDVFRPFKQESEGNTREYEGTGLGLSIVRRFTELMDGSINLESTKGEGTRVTVCLPRRVEAEKGQP